MFAVSEVVVYDTEACPRCKILEKYLASKGVEIKTTRMDLAEGSTELRCNNVFALSSPVLRVGDEFYPDDVLFSDGILNVKFVNAVVGIEE